LLTASEVELAATQFDSIAERATVVAFERTMQKILGTITVAAMYSNIFPNADAWPNVAISGFNNIAKHMRDATANTGGIAFLPLVWLEHLLSFEDFAYDFLKAEKIPGTWWSDFGNGIFSIDPTLNTSDNRYHDTTGETSWGMDRIHRMSPC
jgi:hypothetical protein